MENKVLLYNANNVKIGETFMRRAKQLVKQQRAEWTDDSQCAIRFAPDVEDLKTTSDVDECLITASGLNNDDLVALAEKRINERKWFIIHSIVLIPVWLILAIFTGVVQARWGWSQAVAYLAFISGSWITGYLIHICQYAMSRRRKYRSDDRREERRARRLAAEIALLKSEL